MPLFARNGKTIRLLLTAEVDPNSSINRSIGVLLTEFISKLDES